MAAFGVQTTENSFRPNSEAYESLIGARDSKPIARMGWSYRDDLDLRKLADAKRNRRWRSGKGRDDAWDSHAFLDKVKEGDLLFYLNLPAQGRFTVVKVTGEYGYLKTGGEGGDFRSFRPCKVIVENASYSDSAVGSSLRKHLKLPRRIHEIPLKLAKNFLKRRENNKAAAPHQNGERKHAANLSLMKKKFSYVVGKQERIVNKEHLAYQIRLEKFLESRNLAPKFEVDSIDVEFSVRNECFMGEVKVTNWLSISEAFRIALGQILDYACTRRTNKHGLIIFLDRDLDDPRRLELASELHVSVVAEKKRGSFTLLNPQVSRTLQELFLGG